MWVGPGAEERESSWEKNTFGRTRGAGLSNLHTSLPERLMYPPLVIQQWAQEHYGVYPGSSSHRSTYCPHCCGLRCCMRQIQKSPKIDSMQTLNSLHMMMINPRDTKNLEVRKLIAICARSQLALLFRSAVDWIFAIMKSRKRRA